MSEVRRFFIGILTFFAILIILTFAVTLLTTVNIPRIIPNKNLKVLLGSLSNTMGSATVASITAALRILHKLEWDFQIPEDVNTDTWYIAMSNHQSWADIFILLAAGHKKIPLLKFFMKKELQWIPIIYLVHKTIDMPFLNRHSRAQIQANPELKKIDFENAKIAAKRFSRNPSTAFSFAEGTRFTLQKHAAQESPYSNLLKPKVGALAIALSGMPQVNTLVDFTVMYSSEKRSTWDFLCGDLSKAKVVAKTYALPENLKNRSFEEEHDFRKSFQIFVDAIWLEKQQTIKDLKF
ncbi:acetyltransferase [Gammaproteobacteria bacterium]|nr:acetyltransferase [Gammaproteobacteria bacterium]